MQPTSELIYCHVCVDKNDNIKTDCIFIAIKTLQRKITYRYAAQIARYSCANMEIAMEFV